MKQLPYGIEKRYIFRGYMKLKKIYDDIKYVHITFPLSLLKEEFKNENERIN